MDFNITKYHCGTDEIQEVELTLKLTTHEWYELKNQGVLELPKDLLKTERRNEMKLFEKYYICPNCRKALIKEDVLKKIQDEDFTRCNRCGIDITPEMLDKARNFSDDDFDEFLICENCGNLIIRKEALKEFGKPDFINYCGTCGIKVVSTMEKALATLND